MDGRIVTGSVEIRVAGSTESETAAVTGRCSKKARRVKLKLITPDGDRIKVKVRTFF